MAWATVAEADTYLSETVGGDTWTSLTESQKGTYITTAYRKLTADPSYSFPDTASQNMIDANIEYAFSILKSGNESSAAELAAAGVQSFRIGNFSETLKSDKDLADIRSPYPLIVQNLLDQYRVQMPARALLSRTVGLVNQ